MRRDVWYRREDPVVLPRSRGWSIDYRLIAAALVASAVVTGATYAAFYTAPPSLAETPTAPIPSGIEWQPDPALARANALEALSGPAYATRDLAATEPRPEEVFFDAESDAQPARPGFAPSPQEIQQPSAAPPDAIPYPNPITTPPDAIAPPATPADTPTPVIAPDNPYR
jgi:hypothetical protein